jgi:hypothetical protein
MKKFFVSVGLAAAGTASLHAAYVPDANAMDSSKLWNISGTLRGFYDDNYTTSGDSPGSFGFEVSPEIEANVPLQQTELGARYTYALFYYQDRAQTSQDPIDQTHQLDLWLDHAFTERVQGRIQDSFVVGQEPELLDQLHSTVARADGNNIVNSASFSLNTDWTRLFSTGLSYNNSFSDYENSGTTLADLESGGAPSLAGALNRLDNSVALNFQWHAAPEMMFQVGYQYDQVNYTGDEPIVAPVEILNPITLAVIRTIPERFSDSRDNRSHAVYLGTEWAILPNLNLSGNVGVQYTDYYNDPAGESSSLGPYAVLSLTYTYMTGCYAQLGFTHARNATDEVDVNTKTGSIALDQESSLIYGSINQQITPKLQGSLIWDFQDATFNGGANNNESDLEFDAGVNFNYIFSPHFSGDVGYNYDNVTSDISGRSYSRNRVYVGLTATY